MNSDVSLGGQRLLLFGGSGAIGGAIDQRFHEEGWQTVGVSRSARSDGASVRWDPISPKEGAADPLDRNPAIDALRALGPFDAVCWAQGVNLNDSVYDFDAPKHENAYRVNVLYVLNSLHILLLEKLLRKPARLCVISSIWQNLARQSKLS